MAWLPAHLQLNHFYNTWRVYLKKTNAWPSPGQIHFTHLIIMFIVIGQNAHENAGKHA